MFARLLIAGLNLNSRKSCLGAHKFYYLGYHDIRDGVMPIPNKVEAIQSIAVPKTCKQLRQLISMINIYRDMWQKCSYVISPLTSLSSKNNKYEWKEDN